MAYHIASNTAQSRWHSNIEARCQSLLEPNQRSLKALGEQKTRKVFVGNRKGKCWTAPIDPMVRIMVLESIRGPKTIETEFTGKQSFDKPLETTLK